MTYYLNQSENCLICFVREYSHKCSQRGTTRNFSRGIFTPKYVIFRNPISELESEIHTYFQAFSPKWIKSPPIFQPKPMIPYEVANTYIAYSKGEPPPHVCSSRSRSQSVRLKFLRDTQSLLDHQKRYKTITFGQNHEQ